MAETASRTRSGVFTEPNRCAGCHKTFWANKTWNRVTVICPHCSKAN